MDGAIAAGLIAAAVSVGVNGVGWTITLWKGSKQEAKLQGAFQQKLEDVCETVEGHTGDIKDVKEKIEKVDDRITNHIVKHGRKR